MGLQISNATYLKATEKFIKKDAMAREVSTGRAVADQERQECWKCLDMSRDSPRQGNGYDCEIFTLTSMTLARNGLCLSKKAYTQGTITLWRARRHLAERIRAMRVKG